MMKNRRLYSVFAGSATLLALSPLPAQAHAFKAGAESFAQFVQGTTTVFTYPPILLPLVALGILLTLWDLEGMIRAWPALVAGQLIGIVAAAFAGPWAAYVPLAVGVVAAVLAALQADMKRGIILGIAFLSGLATMFANLEGHKFFEVPVLIQLGMLFGANFSVAASAGVVRIFFDRINHAWIRIPWRIISSWLAAILVLYLTFALQS